MRDYDDIDFFFSQFSEIKEILADETIEKMHIYAIFDSQKNLLYIGKSENVESRFKEPKKKYSFGACLSVCTDSKM